MFKKFFKKKSTETDTPFNNQYNVDTLKEVIDILLTTNISFEEKELAINALTKDTSYFFHSLLIILLEYTRTGVQKLIVDGTLTQEDFYLNPKEFQYIVSRLLLVLTNDKDDSGSEIFITFIGILILSRSKLIPTHVLSYLLKEISQANNIEKEHVCKVLDEVINMFFLKDKLDDEASEKLKDAVEDFVH